jgi:hypothetical protein
MILGLLDWENPPVSPPTSDSFQQFCDETLHLFLDRATKKYLVSDQSKKAELQSSETETEFECSNILTTGLASRS